MTNNGEMDVQAKGLATEVILTEQASKRASADPLPGPLKEVFCDGPIEIAGKIVYKVVPRYFAALKALDSPIISMLQDVVQTGKVDTELTDEQAWEICWIFTHTGKEVRAVLDKGPKCLKEASQNEVGDSDDYPVNLVTIAVMEQLKRHLSTAMKHGAEAVDKGAVSFFRDSAMLPSGATVGS
jgi:hypothetical protein